MWYMYLMISHIPVPICVKLSEIVDRSREMDLGPKKLNLLTLAISQNFAQHCRATNGADLIMPDDSLGFEDRHFATHLLNYLHLAAPEFLI